MTGPRRTAPILAAFEPETVELAIESIAPVRQVNADMRRGPKYAQIAASIEQVGLVEPPVVAREKGRAGGYILLDGHLRLDILRSRGTRIVRCLVATDDEGFTYNRRISRLAMVQENRMILAALDKGVPEEKLARALNIGLTSLRAKRDLLSGICPEAADLLKDRIVAQNAFFELKRMKPLRQMEAAELMVAMNRYSVTYVRTLVAATPPAQLIEKKLRKPRSIGPQRLRLMEREAAALDREFRRIEQDFGIVHLDLVLARAYVGRLLGNVRIVR
jgi:ParB-like chromosome segregation protein Spo0J